MKERVTFTQDFWQQGKFFFHAPTSYDEQVIAKKWNEDVVKVLTLFSQRDYLSTAELTAAVAKDNLRKCNYIN
jgi:glutamyl-tRNA synthetase